jgi:hypothetical protein
VWDDNDFEEVLDVLTPVEIVTAILMTEWAIDEQRAFKVFSYLAQQARLDPEAAALDYLNHGQMRPTI